ncbi:MAG: macro domain-containing protein [candidate division KSB1 bacterium]|nr:macro domain-containing protein [candidate division KSB1 bacterium]
MITFAQGDILKADAEALVNTVNTVGVMGKGIALQFKKAYPENYNVYKKACDHGDLKPGKLLVYDRHSFTHPRYIINFPTKTHWKSKSRYEYIESGLETLKHEIKRYQIHSIAVPPLGSGLGGLDWNRVRTLITQYLEPLKDVQIFVYEPHGAPPPQSMIKQSKPPKMTHGRASLLELMRIYAVPGYDYRLSLLEIQKLMYFLQEAGVPLKLQYEKGHYGPYADNLRHVLHHIEGHFIVGFGDGQNAPDVPVQIRDESVLQTADAFLQPYNETREKIDRVKDLIEGFETPYGMELLASVHWVCTREVQSDDVDQVIDKVHQWNPRKRDLLKAKHIHAAWQRLRGESWI